jgi:hypothetical protein
MPAQILYAPVRTSPAHWDAIGQPQFVTFRLHGSLPATRGFRREHVATSGEAFLVRSDEELRRIERYIELNPVKAGCVQESEQFRWSSAGAT